MRSLRIALIACVLVGCGDKRSPPKEFVKAFEQFAAARFPGEPFVMRDTQKWWCDGPRVSTERLGNEFVGVLSGTAFSLNKVPVADVIVTQTRSWPFRAVFRREVNGRFRCDVEASSVVQGKLEMAPKANIPALVEKRTGCAAIILCSGRDPRLIDPNEGYEGAQ